uniref:Uncharacterized protein n=1 Tax=viral metagenome TaxID=1070528 RepID=A0A6C0CMD3_9ZZZZ
MTFSLWLLGAILTITLAIGLLLYFFVFDKKLTSIQLELPQPITPGSTVRIKYAGSQNTKGIRLAYSVDNSKFTDIVTISTNMKSYDWVLPTKLYTNKCLLRATLGSSSIDAPTTFAVTPLFSVETIASKIASPGTMDIDFQTDFDDVKKIVILTSKDGINFASVPSTSPYSLDKTTLNRINWTLNDRIDASYVQISTSGLVAQGYPAELSYTYPNKIEFQYFGHEQFNFTTMSTYADANASVALGSVSSTTFGYVLYGNDVYVYYTTQNNIGLDKVKVEQQSYTTTPSNSGWVMPTITAASNLTKPNYFKFTLPTSDSTTQIENSLAIRIQDTSDMAVINLPSITVAGITVSKFMHVVPSPQLSYNSGKTALTSYVIAFVSATIAVGSTWSVRAQSSTNPADGVAIVVTPTVTQGRVSFTLNSTQAGNITPAHNTLIFQTVTSGVDLLKSENITIQF